MQTRQIFSEMKLVNGFSKPNSLRLSRDMFFSLLLKHTLFICVKYLLNLFKMHQIKSPIKTVSQSRNISPVFIKNDIGKQIN